MARDTGEEGGKVVVDTGGGRGQVAISGTVKKLFVNTILSQTYETSIFSTWCYFSLWRCLKLQCYSLFIITLVTLFIFIFLYCCTFVFRNVHLDSSSNTLDSALSWTENNIHLKKEKNTSQYWTFLAIMVKLKILGKQNCLCCFVIVEI